MFRGFRNSKLLVCLRGRASWGISVADFGLLDNIN
jgi:hypothetical protein